MRAWPTWTDHSARHFLCVVFTPSNSVAFCKVSEHLTPCFVVQLCLASIDNRGFKEWHPAEAPKDLRETLHKLTLQSRLRIMLIQECRAQLVKIVGVLAANDKRLRRQSVLP